jgi:hypothetical protein
MPSFMGRECIITAMPAEVHYDGGSEADRKRIPAVRQRRKKDAVDCTAAQAVAAALLASAVAIPSRRKDQGGHLQSSGDSALWDPAHGYSLRWQPQGKQDRFLQS